MIDETEKAVQRSLLKKDQESAVGEFRASYFVLAPRFDALLLRVEQLEKANLELQFKQFELEGRDWAE